MLGQQLYPRLVIGGVVEIRVGDDALGQAALCGAGGWCPAPGSRPKRILA